MKKSRLNRIIGIFGGLILLGFISSFFVVRMTEPPAFCARCHVMKPMYNSFIKSTHAGLSCNDCHTPQDNYVTKVLYKGMAGTWDAYVYFTGQSPQVFETKPRSKKIIKRNCIRCHKQVVAQINTEPKECFGCHRYLPHGVRGPVRANL